MPKSKQRPRMPINEAIANNNTAFVELVDMFTDTSSYKKEINIKHLRSAMLSRESLLLSKFKPTMYHKLLNEFKHNITDHPLFVLKKLKVRVYLSPELHDKVTDIMIQSIKTKTYNRSNMHHKKVIIDNIPMIHVLTKNIQDFVNMQLFNVKIDLTNPTTIPIEINKIEYNVQVKIFNNKQIALFLS